MAVNLRNQLIGGITARPAVRSSGLSGGVSQQAQRIANAVGGQLQSAGQMIRSGADYEAEALRQYSVERAIRKMEQGSARTAAREEILAQGSPVSPGTQLGNLSPLAVASAEGKGGVVLTSIENVAIGAGPGIVATCTITDAIRSRVTQTFVEFVQIIAFGQLADPDQLARMEATMTVNGRQSQVVFQQATDLFAPNLQSQQLLPVREFLGSDADLQCSFNALIALTTTVQTQIALRLYCGNGTTWDFLKV